MHSKQEVLQKILCLVDQSVSVSSPPSLAFSSSFYFSFFFISFHCLFHFSFPPGSQTSWPALFRAHKHIFCDVCQLPGLAWLTPAQLRLQFFLSTAAESSGARWNTRIGPEPFAGISRVTWAACSPLSPTYSRSLPLIWFFLAGLEGPERGQSGLVCKWEPYCGYLLFHLSPPFALESKEATDV